MKKILILFLLLIHYSLLFSKLDESVQFDAYNKSFQTETGCSQSELSSILTFLKGQEKDCSWRKEYHIITNLINHMNLRVGCEIGVAYGFQSMYFLDNCPLERLYSVDPYMHFDADYDDFMNFSQKYFDVLYTRVKHRLADYSDKSVLLRKNSVEAAQLFTDGMLDFVYIDANHSFMAVSEDLQAWVPKVRSGGLVAGDDYVVFPSTARAVDAFVKKNNIELCMIGNKWWFIKP